jgi:hypothetical protein
MERLKDAGIVHPQHTMSEHDQRLVETLSKEEVEALISVKHKLGDDFVKKTMKEGKFPHPASFPL